ncbi:MAG TPA: AIR synthase-related protein, partial [Thermomicrobiales bacterium]|nr:AIR synthase-related protein [Thermomicrobiales bacterium]
RAKASGIGNIIVMIGAETGRDGLHGATFASVDDPEASHRGVVQVGNPFLEKQLMEACLELLQGDAVVAMQDLGAAGLTSSIVECASRGGVGIDIDVAKVPRRETGMTAYEVMLSESQERMVLVAPPDRFGEIAAVLDKWSLSSALIGHITDDGIVRIRDGEDLHVEVPVTFFIDECPTYVIGSEEPAAATARRTQDLAEIPDIMPIDVAPTLMTLVSSLNLGSRRSVWEQYDHTILTNTVVGPGAGDAAVLRIKGTNQGLAISIDCNSRYCAIDPYLGAQYAVAEASRNVSCAGGRPLGFTNCLNFGNPERSPANWQLTWAVKGMGDACRQLNVPIVSGNVSLYNETDGAPIQPTPTVGCVGVLDRIDHATAIKWADDDDIWLAGDAPVSLGGSEYLHTIHNLDAGALAPVDFDREKAIQAFARAVAASGLASGIHDVGSGGLAVAIAEFAMSTGIGASIEGIELGGRADLAWFGEGASRIVVASSPESRDQIPVLASEHGVSLIRIGTAGGSELVLDGSSVSVTTLIAASDGALATADDAIAPLQVT